MSLRVRCTSCRSAFVGPADQAGHSVVCPKCGTRHRLPSTSLTPPEHVWTSTPADEPMPDAATDTDAEPLTSVYVPSDESLARSRRSRWLWMASGFATLLLAGVAGIVYWPRVRLRPLDPVERVAVEYLTAL